MLTGRVVYVDPIGGAAGDMLLAALLDAGADLAQVQAAVDAVLPGRFRVGTEEVRRGGVRARLLRVEGDPTLAPRPLQELALAVEGAALPDQVRAWALAALDRLGRAESRVHGLPPDRLALHELGDDDTLVDVVGVAAALRSLEVERVLVSPIPLSLQPADPASAHPIPPAAAALELLRGFRVRGTGGPEPVTPTGAALLASLGRPAPVLPEMTVEAVGYGAGTREEGEAPNVVRVVVGTEPAPEGRELVVLEASLDDLTPELVADATESLRAAGALDVWVTPVQMKKGRPGVVLSALGPPEAEGRLRRAFFEATTTFGVRAHRVHRTELERRVVAVAVAGGEVRVKVGLLGGAAVSAVPEHDDVAAVAARTGRAVRDVYEDAVGAARALRLAPAGP